VEDRLENHTENLAELKELKDQVLSSTDQGSLDEQIQVMEEIKAELENEIQEESRGFSLFGWLNRLLNR